MFLNISNGAKDASCVRVDWRLNRSGNAFPFSFALIRDGVIAVDDIISDTQLNDLKTEAESLMAVEEIGNISFEGGASSAYRHQVKVPRKCGEKMAPRALAFCNAFLAELRTMLPSHFSGHQVEYLAFIKNVKGKTSTAQLLHADRPLQGNEIDPTSYSYVLHLPLTEEGQRLSLVFSQPFSRGDGLHVCHEITSARNGIFHVGHFVHAAMSEPDGCVRLRLVVNFSAKPPPPGPETVTLHFVDGKRTTAEPVTAEAANAWKYPSLSADEHAGAAAKRTKSMASSCTQRVRSKRKKVRPVVWKTPYTDIQVRSVPILILKLVHHCVETIDDTVLHPLIILPC